MIGYKVFVIFIIHSMAESVTISKEKLVRFLYHITKLAKRTPVEKLIELCRDGEDKNEYGSFFTVKKVTSLSPLDEDKDILIGSIFPDIVESERQYLALSTRGVFNLVGVPDINKIYPQKNRLCVILNDTAPHLCGMAAYQPLTIKLHNDDDTVDSGQEFYNVYAKKNFEDLDVSNLLCEHFNYFITPHLYVYYCTGLSGLSSGLFVYLLEKRPVECKFFHLPQYIFIRNAYDTVCKFLIHCVMRLKRWKLFMAHKEKFNDVRYELEYLPDFGVKAIEIVDKLNMHYKVGKGLKKM